MSYHRLHRILHALRSLLALASVVVVLSACQSPLDPRIESIVRGPGHTEGRTETNARADDVDHEAEDDAAEPIRKRGDKVER